MEKLRQLLLVSVFVVSLFTSSNSLDPITLGKTIVEVVGSAWNIVNDVLGSDTLKRFEQEIPNIIELFQQGGINKIQLFQHAINQLNSKVGALETETRMISNFITELPDLIRLELQLNDLLNCIADINIWYEKYERYSQNITHFENLTLENFAEEAVSHSGRSVSNLIAQLHTFISPAENQFSDRSVLGPIGKSLMNLENQRGCRTKQSPQQVIYNIFNYITLIEFKGYTMMQFSYMILKLQNKGNFISEAHIMLNKYLEDSKIAIKYLKEIMQPLSREVWRCDPKRHVKGETYVEVTQLLQGYIQNEADLNSEGSCTRKCHAYTSVTNQGCNEDLCKAQRKCNGEIVNCKKVEGTARMHIWLGNSQSGNRYDCIKYFDRPYASVDPFTQFGCKQPPQNDMVMVRNWLRGFVKCDYCFCFCDEVSDFSDRYFNLRPVMADIENNRVVTGLRIVKKNRIIHFQIQEGRLLPRGGIEESTVKWVPVEDYKLTDTNIVGGQDYYTLSFANRSLALDDVLADQGHVITGIRFSKDDSYLKIEVHVSPFDFVTGELSSKPSSGSGWKSTPAKQRTELQLEKPDVSTLSPSSIPDSTLNEYIQFTSTDLYKDAAQNTVPYLDAQPVDSLLPFPLGGVGIYHKGKSGYGGFIAPKIITYDFIEYIEGR